MCTDEIGVLPCIPGTEDTVGEHSMCADNHIRFFRSTKETLNDLFSGASTPKHWRTHLQSLDCSTCGVLGHHGARLRPKARRGRVSAYVCLREDV